MPSATLAGADRLSPPAAGAIRAAIRAAGGREVCLVGTLDDAGVVTAVRVAARGDARSVLALPGFARRGELLVHNHPSGRLEPSDADLAVAGRLHDDGIGFAIVDNEARSMYVVVEVPHVRAIDPLDLAAIDRDLGPRGAVALVHAGYEDRPSQREMAQAVARRYNEGGVALLEAGTGVGKSLGYLIPALRWAAANGERTVVSTNTINLQEQLVGKDLPFLEAALGDQPVRFAMLKGWHNYVCLQRLEQSRTNGSALFEDGLREELDALTAWAARTDDGSLADLPTPPRTELWDEVAAEPDLCARAKCTLFDRCFVYKARRAAAQADVIVVNHHLLLSDIAVRRLTQNWGEAAVLPVYSRLVIDEGHHLEDAAAAHLGATVTRRALLRLLNRLDRKGKGLLTALTGRLSAERTLLSAASLDILNKRLAPSVHAARDRAGTVFDLLDGVLQESGEHTVRLTATFARNAVWMRGLGVALDDLLGEIELLQDGLRLVRDRMEGSAKRDEGLAPLLNEMRAIGRRLEASGDALRHTLRPAPGSDDAVRWIEVRGRERAVAVTWVPLDLAPILRDDLFDRVTTAVVTSATLADGPAIDGIARFAFLTHRLGLDEPALAPTTGVFPSPFPYATHALLAIPDDIAAPNADARAHFAHMIRALVDTTEASDGGVFALCTSHRDVRATAEELRARGIDRRWPLLVHGEESRDTLLRRFRESGSALLVGTASFWEGVDVPGRALRALVITKLPFRVPTDPVTAAHCEAIAARGGDPFADYMLPHASLRLKQGFGRLIRTATDRGVVVVTDPRLVTKRYGRTLLTALPPARRSIGPWTSLAGDVRRFFAL